MVGCDGSKNNSKSDTNKVKESKEKITYVSKGNPVTDNKISEIMFMFLTAKTK